MQANDASPETTRIYINLLERWERNLEASGASHAEAWNCWKAPTIQIRRLTGYALRRYVTYQQECGGKVVSFPIPQRLPRSSRPNPNPVTDEELIQLRASMRMTLPAETSITLRVWLRLLDELGIRRNETPQCWSAFNLAEEIAVVTVSGKTGERTLPLSPKLVRILRWLKRRRPASLWLGAKRQKISPDTMYQQFKKAARSAGLGSLRPHHLRHRRLTKLCRSHLGFNQLLVLAIAGHQHVSSLQHYYRVSKQEMAQALLAA